MKKFFLTFICLALFASENMAQDDSRSNGGSLIDNMRSDAPRLYRSYRTGRVLSNVGRGCTLGGVTAAVIGIVTATKSTTTTSTETRVEVLGAGGALFVVGTIFAAAGTPLWIIGSTKKRNARRAFQREHGNVSSVPHLKLHSSAHGVGVALVF
jgi:hypothetical protein